MRKVYPLASYVTVNLSSPNTPGLRDLQFGEPLKQLLAALKSAQKALAEEHGRYVPLAVKIAPDMVEDDVRGVARAFVDAGIDAVIATNTTISREAVTGLPYSEETGGLSGAPVRDASTEVIRILADELAGAMPIIGVGGIDSEQAAEEKIQNMSTDYADWVKESIEELQQAHHRAVEDPDQATEQFAVIHTMALELRGQGGIFGYPLISQIGKSLYDITKEHATVTPQLLDLIDSHIDLVKVVINQKVAGDGGDTGRQLLQSLAEAKKKFANS